MVRLIGGEIDGGRLRVGPGCGPDGGRAKGRIWVARIRTAVPREGRKGGWWTEGDAPLSVPCMCARLSPRTSTVTPDLVSDWISRSSFASLFVSMVGAVTFGVAVPESRGR